MDDMGGEYWIGMEVEDLRPSDTTYVKCYRCFYSQDRTTTH